MPCQHAGSAPSRAVPRPRTPRVHGLATTTLSQYSASGTLIFTRPLPRSERRYNTRHSYDTHHTATTCFTARLRLGSGPAATRLRLAEAWLRLRLGATDLLWLCSRLSLEESQRICKCGTATAATAATAARRRRSRWKKMSSFAAASPAIEGGRRLASMTAAASSASVDGQGGRSSAARRRRGAEEAMARKPSR